MVSWVICHQDRALNCTSNVPPGRINTPSLKICDADSEAAGWALSSSQLWLSLMCRRWPLPTMSRLWEMISFPTRTSDLKMRIFEMCLITASVRHENNELLGIPDLLQGFHQQTDELDLSPVMVCPRTEPGRRGAGSSGQPTSLSSFRRAEPQLCIWPISSETRFMSESSHTTVAVAATFRHVILWWRDVCSAAPDETQLLTQLQNHSYTVCSWVSGNLTAVVELALQSDLQLEMQWSITLHLLKEPVGGVLSGKLS